MGENRFRGDLVIVKMSVEDLEDVWAIEIHSFSSPWSMEHFRKMIWDREGTVALVAKCGGEVVGYGIAWVKAETFHIGNLAVHSTFRRVSIGELLLRKLMEQGLKRGCCRAVLEVRETNRAAIKLYRKFGFSVTALRPGYYDDTGENAIVMVAVLRRGVGTASRHQGILNVEPTNR